MTLLLILHNLTRWLVVLTAVWAVFVAWRGVFTHATWEKPARVSGAAFSGTMNLQLVIGLLLYFFGPWSEALFGNTSATMQDGIARFFAVEHPVQMILAVIIAQVGFSVSKRKTEARSKYLWAAIAYTAAILIVLASVPWPGMDVGRPLFRP